MTLSPMGDRGRPPLPVKWNDCDLSEAMASAMTDGMDCPLCGDAVCTAFETVNRTPDGFETATEYRCIGCRRAWRVEDQYIHASRVVRTAEWEHKEEE